MAAAICRRSALAGLVLGAGLWLLVPAPVMSQDPTETAATGPELAMGGYDPVSFHLSEPEVGVASWTLDHQGRRYRFASAENRQRFRAAPERYLPAYRGHCAYGVRMGKKLAVDLSAYEIVDQRLFLLLNRATLELWRQDQRQNIAIADRIWPELATGAPR